MSHDTSQVSPGYEVLDSRGSTIGSVGRVEDDYLRLESGETVPAAYIAQVQDRTVRLSVTEHELSEYNEARGIAREEAERGASSMAAADPGVIPSVPLDGRTFTTGWGQADDVTSGDPGPHPGRLTAEAARGEVDLDQIAREVTEHDD